MSRQGSRIQRWLRGDDDLDDELADGGPPAAPAPRAPSEPQSPSSLTPLAPLPVRAPDQKRPQVQGLRETTLTMRRRQVDPQARHRAEPSEPPAHLLALRGQLTAVLDAACRDHDGLVHALLALPDGGALSWSGLEESEARNLAETTSHIPAALGVPADAVEAMTLTLTTGDSVVCVGTGTPDDPAVLRFTLRDTSLGIAILRTQQTARELQDIISASS